MSPTIVEGPAEELEDVRAGHLPERYGYQLQDVFMQRLRPLLVDGVRILDVGAGRSPTLAPEDRPPGCVYLGMDISAEELDAAGPDAYDRSFVLDISKASDPELKDFDVIISWQVLEHVSPLDATLENLRSMLRPGGVLLAQTSGSFAAFALASRLVPHRVRVLAMKRFLGQPEELKFPTRFDRCYASALEKMMASWTSVELVPFYRGATYFAMSRLLQRTYLVYENTIARRRTRNLATHYLIVARR